MFRNPKSMRRQVFGKRLDRRTFLAGTGGLAVSLPFLEAMLPAGAEAQTGGTLRYLLALQGISQSRDTSVGSRGFEPIRARGLESDVAFVQGLTMGRTGPAPMSGAFHGAMISPMLAGVGTPSSGSLRAITSDQVVAREWGRDLLHISTQARPTPGGRLGYNGGGLKPMSHTGSGTITPIESPFAVWDRLFSGAATPPPGPAPTPMPNPSGPTAAERNAQRGLSVLDVASARAGALEAVVSAADWRRIDEHFTAIRELEGKLEDLLANPTGTGTNPPPVMMGGTSCSTPATPTDPATGSQWSNETLRGEIFADMIPLAFACDLTSVCTWMITWLQCHMPAAQITGEPQDLHWITHNDPADGRGRQPHQDEYTAWHVNQYARLIENLKRTTDGTTGAPLFDTTVAVMLFESVGAHGFGADGMTALIAGRPSALNLGTTVRGDHPAQLLSSAMHSVGIRQNLGDVPGQIPGLLR